MNRRDALKAAAAAVVSPLALPKSCMGKDRVLGHWEFDRGIDIRRPDTTGLAAVAILGTLRCEYGYDACGDVFSVIRFPCILTCGGNDRAVDAFQRSHTAPHSDTLVLRCYRSQPVDFYFYNAVLVDKPSRELGWHFRAKGFVMAPRSSCSGWAWPTQKGEKS